MGVEIDTLSRTQFGTGHLTSKCIIWPAIPLLGICPGETVSQVWEEEGTNMVRSVKGGRECSKGMDNRSQGLGRTEERILGRFPRGGEAGGWVSKDRRKEEQKGWEDSGKTQWEHHAPGACKQGLGAGSRAREGVESTTRIPMRAARDAHFMDDETEV